MSYIMDGLIVIEPPLNFAEIKAAQKVALNMLLANSFAAQHATSQGVFAEYMPLALHIEESERITDEGILKVKQAQSLRPSWSSNAKLTYDMATLVVALIRALPGHTWIGTVTAVHEDWHGAVKIVVTADGSGGPVRDAVKMVKGTPFIRWADGDLDKASDLT